VKNVEYNFNIKIKIPAWLDNLIASPVLLYRLIRYSYAFRKIPLTQGKYAIVDPEDYEELARYNWYAVQSPRGFYAQRSVSVKAKNGRSGQENVRMHRVILKAPEGKFVDHINHNGLDNRKSNLRICTMQQNSWNMRKQRGNCTSQYKGVSWRKDAGKWQARIIYNAKAISIGFFDDEKAAAISYDAKAKELFGEYASPNLL